MLMQLIPACSSGGQRSSSVSRQRAASSVRGPLDHRPEALRASWQEIEPAVSVRNAARRALRVHLLRATDALQLAAALVAADAQTAQLPFVTLDRRLADAARREGFPIVILE